MPVSDEEQQSAHAILAEVKAKLDRLRNIKPYLIDLSLRENPVGARVGQTLADKLSILPKVREFGFRNILLGTLDYASVFAAAPGKTGELVSTAIRLQWPLLVITLQQAKGPQLIKTSICLRTPVIDGNSKIIEQDIIAGIVKVDHTGQLITIK